MWQQLGSAAGLMVLWGSAAIAGCPDGQEPFNSCQIEGRNTEVFVCFDDQLATYQYGPIGGTPELFLSEPIAQVDYVPWNGIGRAINESVTFYNGEYSYRVGGGINRPFSEEEMEAGNFQFGWLEVAKNGEPIAQLECIPETVSYGWGGGIYEAKVAAGLEWDDRALSWMHPIGAHSSGPILLQQTLNDVTESCLPAEEFSLGGIGMGVSLDTLGKFGTPEPTPARASGLQFDRITHIGMTVDIYKDRVVEIVATEAWAEMPSGVTVGTTRGDVLQILGDTLIGQASSADRFELPLCRAPDEAFSKWRAYIQFGQNKRVESISFIDMAP